MIDIQIYDIKQCFDKLVLKEAMNDLWDSGVKNDHFALLYELNKQIEIGIKTEFGKSDTKSVHEIVAQGGIFGGIQCSNQIDTIGKDCLKYGENVFKYKNCVNIPPLAFVDDLLYMVNCGIESLIGNAYINKKIEMKNLTFGIDESKNEATKCHQIHVGKENTFCPPLKAHSANIKKVSQDKYLGDIINNEGKISKTIEDRKNKANGKISELLVILKDISLGQHYFSIAKLLRNGLLSSMLLNSEVWYPVKESQIEELEKKDKELVRRIFETPEGTPTAIMYLELGCLTIPVIIKARRINYLYYLLTRQNTDLLYRFFKAQNRNPSKGDWSEIIKQDLKDFEITESFEEIAKYKESTFKRKVHEAAKNFSSNELKNNIKSKGSQLKYDKLETQKYLKGVLSEKEAKLLFKIRSNMLKVKHNFKNDFNNLNLQCEQCNNGSPDTQEHITICSGLQHSKTINYDDLFSPNIQKVKTTLLEYKLLWKQKCELMK